VESKKRQPDELSFISDGRGCENTRSLEQWKRLAVTATFCYNVRASKQKIGDLGIFNQLGGYKGVRRQQDVSATKESSQIGISNNFDCSINLDL
jgi:hypothetical protein